MMHDAQSLMMMMMLSRLLHGTKSITSNDGNNVVEDKTVELLLTIVALPACTTEQRGVCENIENLSIDQHLLDQAFPKEQDLSKYTDYSKGDLETSSDINGSIREDVFLKPILRYMRDSDKLMAICSILLKSRCFHLSSKQFDRVSHLSSTISDLSIVNLPRTKNNKPFLPMKPLKEKCTQINNTNQFSISHQYPMIGIVQMSDSYYHGSQKNNTSETKNKDSNGNLGLDIVVYDERLIETMKCFESEFTSTEWKMIESSSADEIDQTGENLRVKNLLFYWCIKEAYTKALGKGLLIPFSSFSISILGLDDICCSSSISLWEHLFSSSLLDNPHLNKTSDHSDECQVIACITSEKTKLLTGSKKEYWVLHFINLKSLVLTRCQDQLQFLFNNIESVKSDPSSFACICYGPLGNSRSLQPSRQKQQIIQTNIDVLSMQKLFKWHKSPTPPPLLQKKE